jgi:hypothetical protein
MADQPAGIGPQGERKQPAASPAPKLEEDPPGWWLRNHGSRGGGNGKWNDGPSVANSCVPGLPRMMAPAARSRDTTCASDTATVSSKISELQVVGGPAVGDRQGHAVIGYPSRQGLATIMNALFAEARIATRCPLKVGLIVNAWSLGSRGAGIAIVDPHSGYHELFPNVAIRPLRPKIPSVSRCCTSSTGHSRDRQRGSRRMSIARSEAIELFRRLTTAAEAQAVALPSQCLSLI